MSVHRCTEVLAKVLNSEMFSPDSPCAMIHSSFCKILLLGSGQRQECVYDCHRDTNFRTTQASFLEPDPVWLAAPPDPL